MLRAKSLGVGRMSQEPEVICWYSGKTLTDNQEWCERGITCNRPWDSQRDDLGLYELEERQVTNFKLLSAWNTWLRSPYCQCTYSSGHRPTSLYCRSCGRLMTPESAKEMDQFSGVDYGEYERIRRRRAGPTWVVVYEATVRAAEVALKLLIKATGPRCGNELQVHAGHNLKILWEQVPNCAKDQLAMEMFGNGHFDRRPHTISATGAIASPPLVVRNLCNDG